MKITELLDMKFKDVLEEFCLLYSAECDIIYGITTHDAVNEISEKYDLCDEPSIITIPLLHNLELQVEFETPDNDAEILTTEKIEEIIEHIGLQDLKRDDKQ